MTDHVPCHVETRRASGAIVVDIVDGDLRHAELVKDALAASRVAIAVAGDALVNVVVVDLGVQEGFDARFEAELRVVDWINLGKAKGGKKEQRTFASRFYELCETYAQDVGG